MTETVHPCIHGKTSKGPCDCKGFVESPSKNGIWKICGVCSHTLQSHGVVVASLGAQALKDIPKAVAPKPVSVPTSGADTSFTVPLTPTEGDPTPKQMRAWLRSVGTPDVGERGRLKPEHIVKARAALMGK